jgi:hypothetical protein
VVELTRLCALQEFAKSCTNTSLALVSQQSPVGMDLGQPHSWRRLVGPRAGQAVRDCSDCAACASTHAPGLQPTLWIRRTRTIRGLELHDNSTRRARGDHGGEMLAPCSRLHAHFLWYVRCLAWLVDLGPLIGKLTGDYPLQLDASFSLAGQSS